ncbi:FAD-dependent oxidoreductase [Micromonospora sp. KC606]|uniref:FAD-dependent oxidoreductase n=1 Tax=Micromonospora sp. KC606 TaxID=2530379 RepID=UPI001046BDEB|nr:FAD-dependent oxidoreductase [Micromonospora sp. KC606]TDC81661.1 FAD-dependent oxidoreductase [Micromonospora sp. KC606]
MTAPHLPARVAVVGPLTGPRAAWGELLTSAARLVTGTSPRWEWHDDRGDAETALVRAHEIVADGGYAAVLGHFNSGGARLALPVYRSAGLPVVLPLATAQGLLAGSGGLALRLCPDDAAQAAAVVRACRKAGIGRLTVAHDGSDHGESLARLLLGAVDTGMSVVEFDDSPLGPHTALAVCGIHHRVADLLRRIRPAPEVPVIVTDDCDVPEFSALAGRAADGVRVVRLSGGAAARVTAAFAALAGALGKQPRERGVTLLDLVRGELPDDFDDDGDPVGGITGAGWQVDPLPAAPGKATPRRYDVAVIGAGVVGLATAAELAEAGTRVAVLAADGGTACASRVSGALVRAFALEEAERSLALEAFGRLWGRRGLASRYGFHRSGSLVLLGADHMTKALVGVEALRAAGVPVEVLTVADLARRWPDLRTASLAGAVWEPAAGYVTAAVALSALADRARRAGAVTLPPRRVGTIAAAPDGGALLDGDIHAAAVVVAAGCDSPGLLGHRWPANARARTRAIRYAIFAGRGRRLPTIVDFSTGMWGRPDGANGYLAGVPVDEWGVPPSTGTGITDPQLDWIRGGAARLPFLATARMLAGRFGTDLYLPEGPLLGSLPGTPPAVVATGWSGGGFKTAPAAAARAAAAALQILESGRGGRTA